DFIIARAAAEIARHPFLDLLFARLGIFVEERFGGHDLARRADAALKAAVLDERLLQGVKLAVRGEPFNRLNMLAVAGDGESQARADQTAIDNHAAHADAAALFGSGETDLLAQGVKQQAVGLDFDTVLFAVDAQGDALFHGVKIAPGPERFNLRAAKNHAQSLSRPPANSAGAGRGASDLGELPQDRPWRATCFDRNNLVMESPRLR